MHLNYVRSCSSVCSGNWVSSATHPFKRAKLGDVARNGGAKDVAKLIQTSKVPLSAVKQRNSDGGWHWQDARSVQVELSHCALCDCSE